jgi:hypothetical protein
MNHVFWFDATALFLICLSSCIVAILVAKVSQVLARYLVERIT